MANKQNKAIVKNDVVEYFKEEITGIKEDADWTAFSNNLFTGTSGEKQCLVTQDINTSHIPAFVVNNNNNNSLITRGIVVFGKKDSYPSIQLGNTPNKLVSYSEINVPITRFLFNPHISLTLYYSDKKTSIGGLKLNTQIKELGGVKYDENWECVRGAVSGSTVGMAVIPIGQAYAIGEIPDNTKIVSFIPKVTVTFTDDTGDDTYCKWSYTNLNDYSWISGNYDLISSYGLVEFSGGYKFQITGKENALTKNGLTTGYTFSYSFPSPIAKGKIYIHQVKPPSQSTGPALFQYRLFATIVPNVDMTVTLGQPGAGGGVINEETFTILAGNRYTGIFYAGFFDRMISYEASGGDLFYEYSFGGTVEKIKFLE